MASESPGVSERLLCGLDIGGTKIGVAIGREDGALLAATSFPTDAGAHPEQLLAEALDRWRQLAVSLGGGDRPAAVGAACPGPVSTSLGRFLDPPNMPAWHGFPLMEWLAKRCAAPSAMMNDADASVLAEVNWGAARGARCAVFLTMSTGMGAGLYLGGDVYEGASSLAGEIGHIRLRDDGPVGFGKRGSVEGYLSGPGMVQVAQTEARGCIQTGEPSVLVELFQADTLTPEALCAAAVAGDAASRRVIERCATELGRLLALLVDLLNPEVIVLGTIGAAHPELFIPRAREVMMQEAIPHSARIVRIEPSPLSQRGHLAALAVALRAWERRDVSSG
ncbi:MAG: ROK family protein [Planctomycetota bacterium]|nr:MAG: ROK family protein [Planctomycetota bacterium]